MTMPFPDARFEEAFLDDFAVSMHGRSCQELFSQVTTVRVHTFDEWEYTALARVLRRQGVQVEQVPVIPSGQAAFLSKHSETAWGLLALVNLQTGKVSVMGPGELPEWNWREACTRATLRTMRYQHPVVDLLAQDESRRCPHCHELRCICPHAPFVAASL